MKKFWVGIPVLFILALLSVVLKIQISHHGKLMNLSSDLSFSDKFRRMDLSDQALTSLQKLEESGYPKGRLLAALLPWNNFQTPPKVPWNLETFQTAYDEFASYRGREFEQFLKSSEAVWNDIQVFPVQDKVTYENSWMSKRNFGGNRGHEGCDLMPAKNLRNFYPVRSITHGVVEKIGWLPQGGYRMGIRSPKGGYFYYAHFSSYFQDFQVGQEISAGDILGYMGDTGYGPEGTQGQFDVHLHVGIYFTCKDQEEISVNPYWILRYLEEWDDFR